MEDQSVVGEMTLWGNGPVWARIAKDLKSWRALAEGFFLQLKDTA